MPHTLHAPLLAVRWILLALVFVGSAPVLAQTGPRAQWKLDEGTGGTTADATGNGNTGTLVNSPVWVTGKSNTGLAFGTGTPLVSVSGSGNLANLQATGLTVSGWINRTASGGKGRIIDKDNQTVGWFFGVTTGGKLTFWSDVWANGSTTSVSSRDSSSVLATGSWVHVAATWDGTKAGTGIHLYINGVANESGSPTTSTGTTVLSDSGTPLTIGNLPLDTTFNFKGTLDELRVYNRVLTPSEIATLADSSAPSVPGSPGAATVSSSQIDVSWAASTDNVAVTEYRVERCTGVSCTTGFTQVGTPTASPFSNTGLTASTTYCYRISARDANGNFSNPSSPPACAPTSGGGGDTTPPSQVTGLAVVASNSIEIDLAWNAATDNVGVTGYNIYRCSGASCTPSGTPYSTSTGTSFNDAGLSASTSYTYNIKARDAASNTSTNPSSNATKVTAAGTFPDCK